jgi:GR25 family glycosyltransferase involved in LPS biosynthesis
VGYHIFHGEGLWRGFMLTRKVHYNPHIHITKNFLSLIHAAFAKQIEVPFSKIQILDSEVRLEQAVINPIALEKVRERIEKLAKEAGIDLKKWDAVKVDDSMGDSLMEQGIGSIIFKGPKMRYKGAIGCYLAHRGLMRNIAEHPDADAQGTLILEDDITFVPDFAAKLETLTKEIPSDWDILYLDKVNPKAKEVSPAVYKFEKQMTSHNNWGNWAYIVRHKSLKDKILPLLEHMIDPVDIQLHKFADKINIYLAKPSLVTLNEKTTYNSNINKLNQAQ